MTNQSNWTSLGAGGFYGGMPAASRTSMPIARSELEATRLGDGKIPQAEYPDGYLSTIRSRRDDRLLDSTKNRINQRSYQRGVHKGERIDPSDYAYPMALRPDRGLRRQMRGSVVNNVRMTPRASLVEQFAPPPHLVDDGKVDQTARQPVEMNARRIDQLKRLMPRWSV